MTAKKRVRITIEGHQDDVIWSIRYGNSGYSPLIARRGSAPSELAVMLNPGVSVHFEALLPEAKPSTP